MQVVLQVWKPPFEISGYTPDSGIFRNYYDSGEQVVSMRFRESLASILKWQEYLLHTIRNTLGRLSKKNSIKRL